MRTHQLMQQNRKIHCVTIPVHMMLNKCSFFLYRLPFPSHCFASIPPISVFLFVFGWCVRIFIQLNCIAYIYGWQIWVQAVRLFVIESYYNLMEASRRNEENERNECFEQANAHLLYKVRRIVTCCCIEIAPAIAAAYIMYLYTQICA